MTDISDMTQAEKVQYWTTGYRLWKALLAGEKGWQAFSDSPCAGFWRKPVIQRDQNGNNKRVGWTPVAIFRDGETMVGRVGNEDMTGDSLSTVWTHCLKHPITEEVWRAVAERGEPWPDMINPDNYAPALENRPALGQIPAANRDVSKADNAQPELSPEQEWAADIDAAIGAALKTVTNEVEAAQALGSKNRIAELRLSCDKAGRSIYEPMHAAYVAVRDPWQAPVKRATEAEKRLNTAILTFRESERKRLAKEQAEAEQRQRELDEANARAADRAIARGEPEPMPEVEEVVVPATPAPIAPTYGSRKLKEQVKIILDKVTNWNALCTYYIEDQELQALLMKLAAADIKAGRTVPGTITREGLI